MENLSQIRQGIDKKRENLKSSLDAYQQVIN